MDLVQAEDRQPLIQSLQVPLQAQLPSERHHADCSRYTLHGLRNRRVQGWRGDVDTIPICRARCRNCGAVFTVLPSFVLRYRRHDADCLAKLLELSLCLGLSQRETATSYS